MRIYGSLYFRERLPDQFLGSDASYAPPSGLYETAALLPVKLQAIELLRKLPAIRMSVVYSPVGVVLDHHWGRLGFL